MDNATENSVLIIGGPNAGKTHFGGQLYGRLISRKFNYKISPNNLPADLTIFEDVINKLAEGKRAGHTEASANRNIELKIDDENDNSVVFTFPDYAGEQVNFIVDNRRINTIWKQYIEQSSSWMLFVRLDDLKPLEDIINKGIPEPEELKKRNATPPPVKVSDAAHFVELLQMLLYIKGIPSLNKINKPNITIVLSCWDVQKLPDNTLPFEVLKQRLPLLYDFVKNNWAEKSLSIIGLSSTGKTLTDEADEEYIDKTPIKFGYIINPNGIKEEDLTLSIQTFIGRE
jgi:GTPase SAR1 family protein